MKGCIRENTTLKHPTKQILPVQEGRSSLVVDSDYLAHLHTEDKRIDFSLGSKKFRFNCVKFANCEVLSEYVRSMAIFAQTVIIEDSSLDCEDLYFNLKNELEFRSGKIRVSTMKVEAKWANIESPCVIDGNRLIITASQSASLSGGYELKNQMCCRSQQISIEEHSSIATSDLLLLPTKSLEIRGALRFKKLFIGDIDEKMQKIVSGTAGVKISGEVEGDKLSIMSSKGVVLSGRVSVNEMDCSSGNCVRVEECRLKAGKVQLHAETTKVDEVSVLEGANFSLLIEDKVVLSSLSSFRFDGLLVIECRTLDCGDTTLLNEEASSSSSSTYRCGDVYISAIESINLGGELKCKKLILKCEQRAADVIIRKNANLDFDSLLVLGNGSNAGSANDGGDFGEVVFDSGSVVICSMFVAIEAEKEVVLKGTLKRALCYSPNLSIKTSRSIKFVNCSVDVGESQFLFGNELVLDEEAKVFVSGKLFLLHHQKQSNAGVLRLGNDCVLVARKDIVCQFGECFVEGTLASKEESILFGRNDNRHSNPSNTRVPEGTEKKEVNLGRVIKRVVRSLKPSSNPLSSLFKLIQEKRVELIQSIQKVVHFREEDVEQKSFVMEYVFISGEIRAKKTVMLVSRDITIQNEGSIKCTSVWDSTAILIYSNRSVFQCSAELDASTVLIVSPIVFQLLSVIKAHNLSISAAAVFRLACVCNSTKTILKSPLILSGLNVVAPNVSKTFHKLRSHLVESFVDVVMLIEKLAQARTENREFEVFLLESMRLFKKHSHLALLHSLELVHFAIRVMNLFIPKTALIVTVNVMSIIRATMFLLFSAKNIRKSIKRYLNSERQNFILVEIIGEAMFSLFQVVGVVTSFTSLYNQIKNIRSSGMNSLSDDIPTLKDLPRNIFHRTRDLVSKGPLSSLSNVLGVFDTFVLNDYTKYAVGLFSYLPSSMSFSILNLSGDMQLGMYVVNNSSACSLNGSVIVLSYNCSSNNIASFSPRSNVVICNGGIYETSFFGKVDRGVKISQRSLVLTGGRRVHDGGFHFGESVVLKTRSFEQQNNRLLYNQIGGLSMKEWKLHKSEFRPSSQSTRLSSTLLTSRKRSFDAYYYDNDAHVESIEKSVIRSGNEIESVSVGDGSVFYLKDVALKLNNISGAISVKSVQVKVSSQMGNLSTLQVAGGSNSFVSDSEVDVDFSVYLSEGGHLSIISPSTNINCKTNGEGHVAFHNARIGDNANVSHIGSTFVELKDEWRLYEAISGVGKYSRIANDGRVDFKVNGEFEISASDENLFFSETSVRENQDLGIIAGSIDVCREVVRKGGIQLFSVEEDVVIRHSIISKDGSVVISSKNGNVIVEDNVEKGIVVTKCHMKTKPTSRGTMSRLEQEVDDGPSLSSYRVTIVDGVNIVKNVEKIELRAKDSVVVTADEGSIILDPCVIHGNKRVVVEGKKGVSMKDICVTSVSLKNSRNPFYSKRKKVIKGVSETTCITSGGDISVMASEGTVFASGVKMSSTDGRILKSGRDGVVNESSVAEVFIKEKKCVFGGLSREQRKEKHEIETPCVFESSVGFYVESERGSIVNVGVIATGNGVCSFKAGENVLFERRILKHEVSVKKQGFDLSLSILGADVFESSSTFFENLKLEFLENHLPPIGSSPVEVARSIREGNVPEIAANLVNALLIPGNLRFFLDAPVKFGLKFNDYDLHHHKYDSLGEGKVEMDFLYINASDVVEFSNSFGFTAGSVEIGAHKLIENGAFLNYELENFSSGFGFSFEPFVGDLLHCVPSLSADLSISKESCSIAICQVGNAAVMKLNVDEWDKSGSQTFAETVQGRVGIISFDSTSTVAEGKMHGISLGTTSLGLSDGHSKSSLIVDQTGIYAVNVDDFHVKTVILKSSRCPVRGTDSTIAEESMEFEKVSGASLGVDFSGFLSISGIAKMGGGKQKISKLKGVGIEKKDYLAVVQNSFASVNESEFHYRVIGSSPSQNDVEREAMSDLEMVHQNYRTLTRNDNSLFVNESETVVDDRTTVITSSVLSPVKSVLKDRSFKLKFHYDRDYHLLHEEIEQMHKEVVDEGLLPCLEGAAYEEVDPRLLYPVLDIFYDASTSELDKYTQLLFFRDEAKSNFCDLSESEKQEVFIYQSYLQDGGDFRDYISLCNFYEEKKQSLNDDYAKKSMKEYVRETYPELYLSTGLHGVENVEDVQRIFMDIKFAYEPDDPMVRQLTFEMDQYYAEQIFEASWAELSSTQQKEIVKIREHALMYQQTDQEVNFGEYLHAKEVQFVDYFANHHQEPDTNVLTSFGILPFELLKESNPIVLECMPYQAPQFDNERKYPVPGSGLFFLPAPPEASGWEGLCEYGSTIKNCIKDHISYFLAGRPIVDYQPSRIEVFRDKSLRSFFSGLMDFIPYVNGAKWSFQGISGFDPITKNRLDWKERVIDLAFSMFYFQPVANVIIGYGKGAVLEPLKGTWMAGKIIVKDRTLKGVFETIKVTGSAAIESISVPTQHLGAFLEMKMMWGVNSGAATFRSASSWFSNKMGSWDTKFWNKWKWSRRNFDIMSNTTRFTSFGTRDFAFACPTVNGNGLGLVNDNQPFMRFAKNDKFGGSGSLGRGTKKKKSGRQMLSEKHKNRLLDLICKKMCSKVSKLGKNAEIRKLPRLSWSDYEKIAKRFNSQLKVNKYPGNKAFERTPQQIKDFRGFLRKDIVHKIQEISAQTPQKVGFVGVQLVDHVHLLPDEYVELLENMICKKMYSKLEESADITRLPRLKGSEFEEIASRFNAKLGIEENGRNVEFRRTADQVQVFRARRRNEILQNVRRMIASNPQDGLGEGIGLIHRLEGEFSDILVDLIARKVYEKLPPKFDIRKLNSLKTVEESVLRLKSSEYKEISEMFNNHQRIKENPQYTRSVKQIHYLKKRKRLEIVRSVKRMMGKTVRRGRMPPPVVNSRYLPPEYMNGLVEVIARELLKRIPLHWDIAKLRTSDLPSLTDAEYKETTNLFNSLPNVIDKPKFARTTKQVKKFRTSRKHEILVQIKEMSKVVERKGIIPPRIGKYSRAASLPADFVLHLSRVFAKEFLNRIPKHWNVEKLKVQDLPVLTEPEYERVVTSYNTHPKLASNPGFERNVKQVKHFRANRKRLILREVQRLAFVMGREGKSVTRKNTKSSGSNSSLVVRTEKLPLAYQRILIDIFCEEMYNLVVPVRVNEGVPMIPAVTIDIQEVITKRYNTHEKVKANPKYQRNVMQVEFFRRNFNKEIASKFNEIMHQKHGIQVKRNNVGVLLDGEHATILVGILSEIIRKKMPVNCNFKEFFQISEIPHVVRSEYELAAKLFNNDSRVKKKFHRDADQIARFRNKHVFQILKSLRGEKVIMKRFKLLPIEFRNIILSDAAEIIYEKIPKFLLDEPIRDVSDLPDLECSDYEMIAEKYNSDPRVKETIFERPVEFIFRQIRMLRSWKREIFKRVKEFCKKEIEKQ